MALIGLEGLHYAIMTQEETSTTPPTYDTPKEIIGINKADLTPENQTATLYGDNKALDTKTTTKKYTVKIDTAKMPLPDQAALLGHSYNSATKKMSASPDDIAPNVAIMFCSDTEENKKWFTTFYKGKFVESAKTNNTRGENQNYDLHSIEGEFVARLDNKQIYSITEAEASDTNFAASYYASVDGGN